MEFGRSKVKVLIISFLAFIVAFSFLSSSCSGEQAVEESKQEEQELEEAEEADTEEEQTPPGEGGEEEQEESEISKKIVTGNINILSGLQISEEINDSRPIAIMVENSPQSRPQSGLDLADVIFEVVDEGGVTRFVAIYSSHDAETIGPVRSARQYYAEIARGFDPVYCFWGTYPEAYKIIENMDMDLLSVLGDQSGNSSITAQASHWRDSSREAPHNGYMSTLQLKEDAKRLGYSLEDGQSPFIFKLDAPNSERGNIENVTVDFSYENYQCDYEYAKESNTYLRFLGGVPHKDRETGEQLTANNIVVMITDIANSGDAAGHMIVRTTNSGKVLFFMDGKVIEGTWSRDSISEPFEYKDLEGNDILFNRGTTWISMIQSIDRIIY
ncbi:MAG: DUF3048 domain-containing protein [Candidatus Humimicrobiaceae bacterium]